MKIKIGLTDYTKNTILPIKTQKAIDESLNQGVITFVNMTSAIPFSPFTEIYIDNEKWFIGKDDVTQTIFGENPRYRHDIVIIEQTKLLEKYFIDTCTFTNPLNDNTQRLVSPEITTTYTDRGLPEFKDGATSTYLTPLLTGSEFVFKKFTDVFENRIGTIQGGSFIGGFGDISKRYNLARLSIYYNGTKEYDSGYISKQVNDKDVSLTLKNGKYVLIYNYGTGRAPLISNPILDEELFTVSYTFLVADELIQKNKKSIADVINKLLLIAEIPRKGNDATFKLNEKQYAEFSLIDAPEFNITSCTLREGLNKIGGHIHKECRLDGNEIYFDELGGREKEIINKTPVAYTSSQDMEQFCSEIDSFASNLVPDDLEKNGSIIEPYSLGYTTPRTETGTVVMNESNAFINTKYKIQKIIKLECGFLPDETKVGDITDYVVEKSIYNTLSSYTDTPKQDSKVFYIYYSQNDKGIRGLNFKLEDAISQSFQKYAITNIINEKLGASYGDTDINFTKLQFRVTYIPIIDTRIKQHKSYLGATSNKKYALAYNQSDYKLSSTYYGENLKGVVGRLGNVEKFITFIYKLDEPAPELGKLYDDRYYISIVKEEILQTYKKVTIGLSKDFNRLNEYVGINNEQRFYEISEKMAVERYSVYEDYLIIGDDIEYETEASKKALAQLGILWAIRVNFKGLSGPFGYRRKITRALVNTYDEYFNKLNTETISLPVLSFPLGNSACFTFSFNNNYGAGDFLNRIGTAKGYQDELRYTDNNGEFEYLSFNMHSYSYYDGNSYNPTYMEPANYSEAVEIGDKIPKEQTPSGAELLPPMISTTDYYTQGHPEYPLRIRKDNRENINITYQIHIVTTLDNVVVGSGMAKTMGVEEFGKAYVYCYILDRKIGQFENVINDELPENVTYSISINEMNRRLIFGTINANKDGESIVFINTETKELIFAINKNVKNGEEIDLPNLILRHDIFDNKKNM